MIIEATYADRCHESVGDAEARLGEAVRRVAARGGKILIPAFALGRCQEVIYSLHQLYRAGKIPELPIYVDSPLGVDITTVFRMHPEVYDDREHLVASGAALFDFPLVTYVRDVEQSKSLNGLRVPRSSSRPPAWPSRDGSFTTWPMASATIATWFSSSGSRRSTRSAAGSSRARKSCASWARSTRRQAEVGDISGYSAHADRNELRAWVRRLGGPVKRAFVVHGEEAGLGAMATILREEGVREVHVPAHGESFDL